MTDVKAYESQDPLLDFVFHLLRDHVLIGNVEAVLAQMEKGRWTVNVYNEPLLAAYSARIAERIRALSPEPKAPESPYLEVREKYVEEHFPRWIKFGGWMEPKPQVGDVSDGRQDIVNSVDAAVADELIRARDAFVDRLIAIFNRHPNSFHVYGPPVT